MTRELNFDPSREPLPPDEEVWGGPLRAVDAKDVSQDHVSPDDASRGETSEDDAVNAQIRSLAAATFHVPSESSVPRDAMWAAISARRASVAGDAPVQRASDAPSPVIVHRLAPRTQRRLWPMFAALAATLVIGIAIGRAVDRETQTAPTTMVAGAPAEGAPTGSSSGNAAASSSENVSAALPLMLARLTAEHLGRSEALLVSAKQDPSALEADVMLQGWARDLLSTTRLLLDTDQLTDPRMRQLLQDLELTLALIMQAQASGRAVDAQAVRDDLDNGDLLLRVRSASMPTMLSTDDVRGMSE